MSHRRATPRAILSLCASRSPRTSSAKKTLLSRSGSQSGRTVSDSTAVENFKVMVFRSLDAASRDFAELSRKVDELRLAQAKDSVIITNAGVEAERVRKLEAAAIDPERVRDLETKVTRLEVRSAIIGAITGGAAAILIPLAVKFFTH